MVAERVETAPAGALGLELQGHLRIPPPEVDHRVGHEVPHGGTTGGDPHHAAAPAHHLVEPPQREVEPGYALGGGPLQHPPGPRRHDAPRLPLDEPDPDLPLQPPYVLAHRRLGAGQLPGHGTEAPGPADGDEDTQIIKGHGAQSYWDRGGGSAVGLGQQLDDLRGRAGLAEAGKIRSTLLRWVSMSMSDMASVARVTW